MINQPTTPKQRGGRRSTAPALTIRTFRPKVARPACACPSVTGATPAITGACSRCGHLGGYGQTCPHCGRFYPLKSRIQLVEWAREQGMGGAMDDAGRTRGIIERLDAAGKKLG